jgi:hypothetical protein
MSLMKQEMAVSGVPARAKVSKSGVKGRAMMNMRIAAAMQRMSGMDFLILDGTGPPSSRLGFALRRW